MDGSSLPEDDDNGDEQDGNKARQMAGRVQAIDANTAEQQLRRHWPKERDMCLCSTVPSCSPLNHALHH